MRVSIVVPAYNAAATVGAAIDSALAQTERDIEVIVVDDASPDGTTEVVRQAAARDPRVRLLTLAHNAGPAAARNRGIGAARGEWIALLDADDLFAPERLATLLAAARDHAADLLADDVELWDEASGTRAPMLGPSPLREPLHLSAEVFIEGNVGSSREPRRSYGFFKPIIRRAFLERHSLRYPEDNRFAEDFMLYVECLMAGAVWWLIPEALYRYRIRSGSLTEVQTSADLMRLRVMDRRLLARDDVQRRPALARAVRRHLRKIDRCYSYRAFTDALKAREPRTALAVAFEQRHAAMDIAAESLGQLPTIARKALRGGYFRSRAAS